MPEDHLLLEEMLGLAEEVKIWGKSLSFGEQHEWEETEYRGYIPETDVSVAVSHLMKGGKDLGYHLTAQIEGATLGGISSLHPDTRGKIDMLYRTVELKYNVELKQRRQEALHHARELLKAS